jgi:hypothetical protein
MEIFRKELKPAEVRRGCICVPRAKWSEFRQVGETVVIQDAKDGSVYEVIIGSQYRLGMGHWYRQHNDVASNDVVVFEKANGSMRIDLLKSKKRSIEVSLPSLVGKEIGGRKIIDIKHVQGKGTVLVVQETREIPVEEVLKEINLN